MYQIILDRAARKNFKKIDKVYLQKISLTLELLANNPLLGEKMAGEFSGSYKIKIPPIRIIYAPDFKGKIIWVRAIGHRQGVYK